LLPGPLAVDVAPLGGQLVRVAVPAGHDVAAQDRMPVSGGGGGVPVAVLIEHRHMDVAIRRRGGQECDPG
jgi:hypothetical protein